MVFLYLDSMIAKYPKRENLYVTKAMLLVKNRHPDQTLALVENRRKARTDSAAPIIGHAKVLTY